MARHDESAKDWGALGDQALVPSAIAFKPKINRRNGAGAQQKIGAANGGTDTAGEAQGGRERTVNTADRLVGQSGQVQVTAKSRANVDA